MERPSVRWIDAIGTVQRLELGQRRLLIGRRADSEILLAVPEVSRQHAALKVQDGCITIEDLSSSHGT